MRRYFFIVVLLLPVVATAQYPGVELYQTAQDYYDSPVGTSYGFDYLAGRHLIEGRMIGHPPTARHIYYNFVNQHGDSLGWVSVTEWLSWQDMEKLHIFRENRAAVTFVDTYFPYSDAVITTDFIRGFGIFYITEAPGEAVDTTLFKQQITDDSQDRFHMIYFTPGFPTCQLRYMSWDGLHEPFGPVVVDDAVLPKAQILTSIRSSKVALVFTRAIIEDNDEVLGGDLSYIISENGQDWDFENDIVQVTDYSDTDMRCVGDLDAVFDLYDIFNVVWNERALDDLGNPTFNGRLMHFSQDEFRIEMITDNFDDEWEASPGYENTGIGSSSIAYSQSGHLYVVWEEFHDSDASDDGYCNGDLYMSYSFDQGNFWTQPENLTNSRNPDCQAGDCASEIFPDLDEFIESDIRLFFLNDRDAGSWQFGEGESTTNTAYMMTISPRVNVETVERPGNISLMEIYPNPFNARTTIKFSLTEHSGVKLEIFDIGGRLVEVLADGEYPAGENSVVWDAGERPSGVYFARLTACASKSSKKLILLK